MLPKYGQPLGNPYYPSGLPRYAPVESQPQYAQQYNVMPPTGQPSYIKGRPVVSIEEARAAQIDLDGSLFVFTDLSNNKIYTKQVNLDGNAVLKTYSLVEDAPTTNDYVTRQELEKIMASMRNEFSQGAERNSQQYDTINEQQSRPTQKTVREQPTF